MTLFTDEAVRMIRGYGRAIEREGCLPQEALQLIYEHRLFKLFVPSELGGKALPLPDALRCFEDAAWIDGNFGWLVTIGAGGGYFVGSMDAAASKQVFARREAVVAGSGFPSGTAKRVRGGYAVDGTWRYCSGAPHATAFTASCTLEEETGAEEQRIRAVTFRSDQVNIVEDWNAFGLKGTGSHSITVENAFVPDELTFDVSKPNGIFDAPIYRYPFLLFAQTSFAAVVLGIGRNFLDEAEVILQRQQPKQDESRELRRFLSLARKLGELTAQFHKARDAFYRTVDRSWRPTVKEHSLADEEIQVISDVCKQTTATVLTCVHGAFPYLGMNAVMEDARLNQIWRDLHTATQHKLLVPDVDGWNTRS